MLILGIDTSGHTASAAICSEERVLAQASVATKLTHSQIILPMCREIMARANVTFDDIDGIAAAKGPGSYTGLRIGIAAAKGICFAKGCKAAGISTLEALAYNFKGLRENAVICAVMHARQELVYNANFRIENGSVIRVCGDRIIPAKQAAEEISGLGERVYVTGDYAGELLKLLSCDDKNIFAAPPLLGIPLASSLCYAAMDKGFSDPEELNADYLQITKAEKDLEGK